MFFRITYDFIKSYVPNIELVKARSIISPVIEVKTNEAKNFKGVNGKLYRINWDNSINDHTNCYAFAMGWEYSTNNERSYIPGWFAGGLPEKYTDFKDCVIRDLHAVGRRVYDFIDGKDIPKHLPVCDEKTYWVKAMIRDYNDIGSFHFARKDEESGRWLHKVGFYKEPSIFMRNLTKMFQFPCFKPCPACWYAWIKKLRPDCLGTGLPASMTSMSMTLFPMLFPFVDNRTRKNTET